jgi:hypothetical protein
LYCEVLCDYRHLGFLSIYEEYKVSISHTPEGTNTESERLTAAVRITSIKVYEASGIRIELCTTPVASGGVTR